MHIFMSTDIIFDYLELISLIRYLHVQLSRSISALNQSFKNCVFEKMCAEPKHRTLL